MLTIYKALIKSRTNYTAAFDSNETTSHNKIIQVIQNYALRICMGYCESAPIPVTLSEAAELPYNFQKEEAALRYISKSYFEMSDIGFKIKNDDSLKKFSDLKQKYPFVEKLSMNLDLQEITHRLRIDFVIPRNSTKDQYNDFQINQYFKVIQDRYSNYKRIYTDGSVKIDKCAFGIYVEDENEELLGKLDYNVSIKTTELKAITEAVKYGIIKKWDKLMVITDSKSTCLSLLNIQKGSYGKVMEKELIKLINDCESVEVIILWVPSHRCIEGNNRADEIAKRALTDGRIFEINIPYEESKKVIKREIWKKWQDIFKSENLDKGKFYREVVNNTIHMKTWFDRSDLRGTEIKIINRVRSGHTYDDKFYKLIKLKNNDVCEICGVVNSTEHQIMICKKFDSIRNRYIQYSGDFKEVLIREKTNNYQSILNFIKNAKISI